MLTALDAQERVVDLTREEDWERVWRTGIPMICRDCAGQVWAKRSHLGIRFMAHAHASDCASGGESDAHNRLKRALADLAREQGWIADVEAMPGPHDDEQWRADLLVTHPATSARVAVEVQLSPQTADDAKARTNRYSRDGITTLWVSTTAQHWCETALWGQIDPDSMTLMECLHDLTPIGPPREGAYMLTPRPDGVDVGVVLRGLLDGTLVHHVPANGFQSGLISAADEDRARNLALIARTLREDERRHAAAIDAMYARQEGLIGPALAEATNAAANHHRVWVGVPPTPVTDPDAVTLNDVLGNARTGMGGAVWVGASKGALLLFGVLAPPANRVSTSLARTWLRRGVKVYVTTPAERARIQRATNLPLQFIVTAPTPRPDRSPPPVHSASTSTPSEPRPPSPQGDPTSTSPPDAHWDRIVGHRAKVERWAADRSLAVSATADERLAHGLAVTDPSPRAGGRLVAVAFPRCISITIALRRQWESEGVVVLVESRRWRHRAMGSGVAPRLIEGL